jgi:hypothetical protein
MKTLFTIGIFIVLLPFTANAATEQEYLDWFKQYEALGHAYDSSVAGVYADDAVIRTERKSPIGIKQTLEMSGAKWKEMIIDSMDLAKKRGDKSIFSNVTVVIDGNRAKIKAIRFSQLKCYIDNKYFMQVEENDDGSFQVIEEFSTSLAVSSCENIPGNDLEIVLEGAARIINKQLPLMVDSDTKLEHVSSEGQTLLYQYTLVNYAADQLDPEELRKFIKPTLQKLACDSPNTRPIVDRGAKIGYRYEGKNGNQVLQIFVNKADCE